MNKFWLWLAILFGGGEVMFIREYNPNDWHCSRCGALLCTVCGSCPRCHPCKHV